MAKFTFRDIGDIASDDLECYENINRSDVMSPFRGEFDKIPAQSDEVKLHFKDDPSQITKDSSGIMQLDASSIQAC